MGNDFTRFTKWYTDPKSWQFTATTQKQQAVRDVATTIAGGAAVGILAKGLAKVLSPVKASKLYQFVRTVKRPVTSTLTRLGVSAVPEKIVTRYGYAKFGVGLLDPLASTRALSRGDYDEAIIGFYGPPGAVHLYRKALESLASSSSPSQQNGGAKGNQTNTSKSSRKIAKTIRPFPKWSRSYELFGPCPEGYRLRGNRCVKK